MTRDNITDRTNPLATIFAAALWVLNERIVLTADLGGNHVPALQVPRPDPFAQAAAPAPRRPAAREFPPSWLAKPRCEGNRYRYNDIGKGSISLSLVRFGFTQSSNVLMFFYFMRDVRLSR